MEFEQEKLSQAVFTLVQNIKHLFKGKNMDEDKD